MARALPASPSQSVSPSVLYICYQGIEEPLTQTQVLPYLEGLAQAHYAVSLLTFEPAGVPSGRFSLAREILRARGIEWHPLRYHKRPALLVTLGDIAAGMIRASYLILTKHITSVHARGYVPAAIAVGTKQFFGTPFVFDIRGLMADEYVDAGVWKAGGLLYRTTKLMETVFLTKADAFVVLTRRAKDWLSRCGVMNSSDRPVEVIPCCVDSGRFTKALGQGQILRRDLGAEGRPILVYTGKLGGWYMTREMVDFYCVAREFFPNLYFLVLTQSPYFTIEKECVRRGLGNNSYRCLTVSPDDVPIYLSIADFAISFIKPTFSKSASSPTKMAEYLASGLPVVYNAGVGDLDDLEPERVGVPIKAFDTEAYERAAHGVRMLLRERSTTALRCRHVAQTYFDLTTVGIAQYLKLYAALRSPGASAGRPWLRRAITRTNSRESI